LRALGFLVFALLYMDGTPLVSFNAIFVYLSKKKDLPIENEIKQRELT